ncbi:unnamed protein product [Cercopithifilaria johnstoni]|uniref:Uncharacterized protein n=1 Tax=Cercopithifilaria johnstoni TaxID=2874296 RepID=A0A8J2LY43_9BILA|nr:unnamed protein product [Cercopithifilaria johnstoni]
MTGSDKGQECHYGQIYASHSLHVLIPFGLDCKSLHYCIIAGLRSKKLGKVDQILWQDRRRDGKQMKSVKENVLLEEEQEQEAGAASAWMCNEILQSFYKSGLDLA